MGQRLYHIFACPLSRKYVCVMGGESGSITIILIVYIVTGFCQWRSFTYAIGKGSLIVRSNYCTLDSSSMMQCLSPLRSLRLRRLTSLHCGNLKALSKAARLGTASKNEKEPPTQPVTSLPATVDNASGTPAEKRLEKFIPLTRRALLRMLMDEKDFLKTAEKQLMEGVAASLDAKYSKRFYSILEHCKVSFSYHCEKHLPVSTQFSIIANLSLVHKPHPLYLWLWIADSPLLPECAGSCTLNRKEDTLSCNYIPHCVDTYLLCPLSSK